MIICVYGAASKTIDKLYTDDGEKLGKEIGKRGHGIVFGGGDNGLMGAVARGVYAENGNIVSVVPNFFNVDGILFEHPTETVFTSTMRERKQTMENRSDAFIITPGGIGTFDEFFEILTLRSLARHKKPIAILNTNGFYDGLADFLLHGIQCGFIRKDITDLYFVSKDCDELIDYVENSAKKKGVSN